MGNLPIVQSRRQKQIRKRELRRKDRVRLEKERVQREQDAEADELRRAHMAFVQRPEPTPVEPEVISRTQQKRQLRAEQRDQRKAEHKLGFLDRLFGLGRGPTRLREKWMSKLGF